MCVLSTKRKRTNHRNPLQVSEMYETTLSALKDEGNERMWFNTYVKLAKVTTWAAFGCALARRG